MVGQTSKVTNKHVNGGTSVYGAQYERPELHSRRARWACLTRHWPTGMDDIATYVNLFINTNDYIQQ